MQANTKGAAKPLTYEERFKAVERALKRNANPVSEYVLNECIINADDSHNVDTCFTCYPREETWDVVNRHTRNEAWWNMALSTLYCWVDDASMFDGHEFSRAQVSGFRKSAARALARAEDHNPRPAATLADRFAQVAAVADELEPTVRGFLKYKDVSAIAKRLLSGDITTQAIGIHLRAAADEGRDEYEDGLIESLAGMDDARDMQMERETIAAGSGPDYWTNEAGEPRLG